MKRLYTEDDVQYTLDDITNRKLVHKASLEQGPPRSTLIDRINGHVSHSEAAAPFQKLALVQEQRLTDWILVQESLGLSLTYTQIRAFTGRILAARYNAVLLGKRQIAGFLRRNPVLKTKKQFRIDSIYINSITSDVLKAWF